MPDDEKYHITDEQVAAFQRDYLHKKEATFYRVCRIRCKCCGDVLERTFQTKEMKSYDMQWCQCGKVALDPHVVAYRVIGYPEDYEDLSEKWN